MLKSDWFNCDFKTHSSINIGRGSLFITIEGKNNFGLDLNGSKLISSVKSFSVDLRVW